MLTVLAAWCYTMAVISTGSLAYGKGNGDGLKPFAALVYGLTFPVSVPLTYLSVWMR